MGFTRFSGLRVGGSSIVSSAGGMTQIQKYVIQFADPDLSSGPSHANSTFTVTGATTNATYYFTPRAALSSGYAIGHVYCSTADEVVIGFTGNSASSLSGSTNRGQLVQIDWSST